MPGAKDGVTANCKWCGRSSHPGVKTMDRFNCPAYKKECHKCHIKGHFGVVCEKSRTDAAHLDGNLVEQPLEPLPSEASMSFSFGAQGFRQGQTHNENT